MDLTGTDVTDDVLPVLYQFPKLQTVSATETGVSIWAVHHAKARYVGRDLGIIVSMFNFPEEFVRWSDGERTEDLKIDFEFAVELPPIQPDFRPLLFRRRGVKLDRRAFYVSPEEPFSPGSQWWERNEPMLQTLSYLSRQDTHWRDGEYRLTLRVGPYAAEPVIVRIQNNTAERHRIEFRMPCTKAEALTERGASAP
jgi:hypothetical protein